MLPNPSPIALIAGLGNPGSRYEQTRHNAGAWFVDRVANSHGGVFRSESRFHGELCRIEVGGDQCWLLKPSAYMNRSGQAVSAVASYYRLTPEQILVAHDELDLPPGVVRFKQGGGHGGHNGLRDIMAALGSRDFYRLRLGIDHPGHRDDVTDYVLGKPGRADFEAIETAIDLAVEALPSVLSGQYQQVMNRLHACR